MSDKYKDNRYIVLLISFSSMYYSQDRSFQANQLRRVATSEMEESEWEKFFQGNPA